MDRRFTQVRPSLQVERLEARDVPSADPLTPDTTPQAPPPALTITADQSQPATDSAPSVVGQPLKAMPRARYAVGSGYGQASQVNVYDSATNALIGILTPFGYANTSGVRVATGDVTGDGIEDIVVAAGPGSAPWVKVYDGATLREVRAFLAYGVSFTGGVAVAAGDVDGDGRADVITGAGPGGGPHVQVFAAADLLRDANPNPAAQLSFFAYAPTFTGGVNVAAADFNDDGHADVVTGAGPGGGPHVEVFSGSDRSLLASFFAYDPTLTTGVQVTAGDVMGYGRPQVATAPMDGGGADVRVFDGGQQVANFFPFGGAVRSGASVAARDVDGDGRAELIVAVGPKVSPRVVVMDATTGDILRDFPAFMPQYLGGLYVG